MKSIAGWLVAAYLAYAALAGLVQPARPGVQPEWRGTNQVEAVVEGWLQDTKSHSLTDCTVYTSPAGEDYTNSPLVCSK